MTFQFGMLAQERIDVGEVLSPWYSMTPELRDRLIMFAVFTVMILALMFWAAFLRKAKKKRKRITRPHNWEFDPKDQTGRHRHRHRRGSKGTGGHSANPTLAETGGLPPIRSGGSPVSSAQKD
jgi:hypothetical protein